MSRSRLFLAAVALVVLLVRCGGQQTTDTSQAPTPESSDEESGNNTMEGSGEMARPSMVQLLAAPQEFHGRQVQLTGYLVLEFENQALYMSESAAANDQFSESIWVTFAEGVLPDDGMQRYNRHMVMVEGTFNAEERGHMGIFSGHLDSISRAVCEPSQQDGCQPQTDNEPSSD